MRAPCVRDTGPGAAEVRGWRAFMYFLRAECPMQLGRAPYALELSAPPSPVVIDGRHTTAHEIMSSMRIATGVPPNGATDRSRTGSSVLCGAATRRVAETPQRLRARLADAPSHRARASLGTAGSRRALKPAPRRA